jgi:hypothetical protein
MRSFAYLLLTILLFCSSTYGQDISHKYPDLIDQVKRINAAKSFTVITLENEEFLTQTTDAGGELTGYFKNDQIQKITRRIGYSYGIETYDYYFENGELIFVYEILDGFIYKEATAEFDHRRTARNFTGRYYFKGNKLIDMETTGHNRFEDDTLNVEATLISEMKDCLHKLTARK